MKSSLIKIPFTVSIPQGNPRGTSGEPQGNPASSLVLGSFTDIKGLKLQWRNGVFSVLWGCLVSLRVWCRIEETGEVPLAIILIVPKFVFHQEGGGGGVVGLIASIPPSIS